MKTTARLLLVFALSLSVMGCTKFEEGNNASILSVKNRLCRTWKPIKYHYPNGSSTTEVEKGYATFRKDGTGSIQFGEGGLSLTIDGYWELYDNNSYVNFKGTGIGNSINEDYEIVKLTVKKLKLRDKNNTVVEYNASN